MQNFSQVDRFARSSVQKIGGGVKSYNPILERHVSLQKKSMHDIIGGSYNSFGFPILRGCVGA
jgi:hypothetical protein